MAADLETLKKEIQDTTNPKERRQKLEKLKKTVDEGQKAINAHNKKVEDQTSQVEKAQQDLKDTLQFIADEEIEVARDLPAPDWTPNKYCAVNGILAFSTAGFTVWDIIKRKEIRDRTYSADGEPVKTNVFVTAYTIVCCFIAAWGILSALGPALGPAWSPSKNPHFYQKFWLVLQILACQCMIRSRIESISNPDSDESHKTEKRFVLGMVWVGLFVLLMYKTYKTC